MLEVLLFIVAICGLMKSNATDMLLLALWKCDGSTAETITNDMAFACPHILSAPSSTMLSKPKHSKCLVPYTPAAKI